MINFFVMKLAESLPVCVAWLNVVGREGKRGKMNMRSAYWLWEKERPRAEEKENYRTGNFSTLDGGSRRPRRSGFLALFDFMASKIGSISPSRSSKSL